MSFDKLAFVKRLEGPDTFNRPQAEALSEAFDQAIHDSVATKEDLLRLETGLGGDMSALQARLTGDMAALDARPSGEMSTPWSEFRGEISTFRAEMRGYLSALRSDIHRQITEIKL